jgi:hypothetical protein
LSLRVAGYNLRSDQDPETPRLVRIKADVDAFLVITFAPQSIAETAYYEYSGQREDRRPGAPPPEVPTDPRPNPGGVPARLAGGSRLVFRVPEAVAVPYTLEGLLDWSALELVTTPIADLPSEPSDGEIAHAPAVAPPDALHTAIELPYRLIISPNSQVAWLHAAHAVTRNGRTELWHTRLAVRQGKDIVPLSSDLKAPLRAIWTPDYTPVPGKNDKDPDLGRTAMNPNDRYQIVRLTSDYAGFRDQHLPPIKPAPFEAEQLMLSTLGGWMRSRGQWNLPDPLPPGGRRPRPIDQPVGVLRDGVGQVPGVLPEVERFRPADLEQDLEAVFQRPPARDDFDLTEWNHRAAQGRDHYVRLVYAGYLYPCGHHASLIKVTERRFIDIGGTPAAYLIQYAYVVVREPLKDYTHAPYDHNGLEMPLKQIRLTTLVTPHIMAPDVLPAAIPLTDGSFWIMDNATTQDVPFHAIGFDMEGHAVEFTASLIFVRRGESHLDLVQQAYAADSATPNPRRACRVPGQKVTFAPPNADPATDNTTLTTLALHFDTELKPEATSFGGFLPMLYKADVKLPAVEQLLGTSTPTTIALYPPYLAAGHLDANAGVFAQIVRDNAPPGPNAVPHTSAATLPITFDPRQAGGISTPNMNLSALTREHGPTAGDPANAAADMFHAGDFFGGFADPNQMPKLFGSLALSDILPAAGSAAANAPKIQFQTVDVSPTKKVLVTVFDWQPRVGGHDTGIVDFEPLPGSTFTIHGRVEKPITLPPAPPAPDAQATSSMDGTLTNFTVSFFHAVILSFASFSFHAATGQRMDVNVKLLDTDPDHPPVSFDGDLKFINDLSKIIPPGALGDGPQLDVTSEGVHLGYGIGLPPVSIGVFALSNLAFSAGLDLPWATGSPQLDFAFASRHSPFLLAVELLGGGGFVHIQLDTGGIKLLEAALEFGAVCDLDLFVASGSVHIMAGVYFALQRKDGKDQSVLSGYLRIGGELSVLGLISVSVEFLLTFSYESPDKISGRATLTVSVQVAFFSKSVDLTVERRFGAHSSDPSFADLMNTPDAWHDYALAFA